MTTPTTPTTRTAPLVQPSPHYSTTRRHSLYGTEDRVVVDPGSVIWKVGFSGEGRPRTVFSPSPEDYEPLWRLSCAPDPAVRAEDTRVVLYKLEHALRKVFHDCLLTDPKSRKVIVVEHPLLPSHIKNAIAAILFDNLQVPSISFAPSPLLSLLAAGRITGLVLDCGYLESIVLPIFASRPLYPLIKTTPLAGDKLRSHLHTLLTCFATYHPPIQSLAAAVHVPAAARSTRVPPDLLSPQLLDIILTRCCFVGPAFDATEAREFTPTSDDIEIDPPPASDSVQSDSEYSHTEPESSAMSSQEVASEFSAATDDLRGDRYLQSISALYRRHSTATDVQIRVTPPPSQSSATGLGTLDIPGWIRERVAEVLFDRGDVDESSLAELVLEALLKVPVDLRKTMASSILVAGGTPMLPGFIPRLHEEIHRTIASSLSTPLLRPVRLGRPPLPPYDRYAPLRPLIPAFSIINDPSPPPPLSERAAANAGKAPAFTPAAMAWVGGSLAGSLKTGGSEISREKWDEANTRTDDEDTMILAVEQAETMLGEVIPDWTRTPLSTGAPHAARFQAEVGA